jgi:hypothetical protein
LHYEPSAIEKLGTVGTIVFKFIGAISEKDFDKMHRTKADHGWRDDPPLLPDIMHGIE